MPDVTFDFVASLYEKHLDGLRAVREEQRARHANGMKVQLDDLEAEVTYLLLREYRPATVVEIGSLHGWSTTWLLSALRDNGSGQLNTYDLIDNARNNVPTELAEGRWTFHQGDIKENLDKLPESVDYLFIDAAHTASFGRWYVDNLFPRMAPGTPTSVHDVFHFSRTLPFHEGKVVVKWLRDKGISYFTPSRAHAREVYDRLYELKEKLGIAEPVHTGKDNPMIYFNLR